MKKTITLIIAGLLIFNSFSQSKGGKNSTQKAATVGNMGLPYSNYYMDSMVTVFDFGGGVVMNFDKWTFEYNQNDRVSEMVWFEWDVDKWVLSEKYELFYDENLDDTLSKVYSWDGTSSWDLSKKEVVTFDNSHNETETLIYIWDANLQVWKVSEKYVYEYGVGGIELVETDYTWDATNSLWVAADKGEFDNNTWVNYKWNSTGASWDLYDKQVDNNDAKDFLESSDLYDWDSDNSIYTEAGTVNISWYYHNKELVSILDFDTKEIGVYPNPADNYVVFDLGQSKGSTLQIFNTQGIQVNSQEIKGGQEVSVEELESGVYFYSVSSSEGIQSGKFVVN